MERLRKTFILKQENYYFDLSNLKTSASRSPALHEIPRFTLVVILPVHLILLVWFGGSCVTHPLVLKGTASSKMDKFHKNSCS